MNTAFLKVIKDRKLAHDLRQVADDFEILDFFKQYGTCCFAMSAMLAKILTQKAYAARVQGCYAEITQNKSVFHIGYKGPAYERQNESHTVCIVDEQYLIDFGLGTFRKLYAEDFSHALACEISGDAPYLGNLELDNGAMISWRAGWISPMAGAELEHQLAVVEHALSTYEDFQKNRMAFLVKKLFSTDSDPLSAAVLKVKNSPPGIAQMSPLNQK